MEMFRHFELMLNFSKRFTTININIGVIIITSHKSTIMREINCAHNSYQESGTIENVVYTRNCCLEGIRCSHLLLLCITQCFLVFFSSLVSFILNV